jgi:hypothetical protein
VSEDYNIVAADNSLLVQRYNGVRSLYNIAAMQFPKKTENTVMGKRKKREKKMTRCLSFNT